MERESQQRNEKNQMKVLKRKGIGTKMKNSVNELNSRLEMAE